jgi:hypothetical protein
MTIRSADDCFGHEIRRWSNAVAGAAVFVALLVAPAAFATWVDLDQGHCIGSAWGATCSFPVRTAAVTFLIALAGPGLAGVATYSLSRKRDGWSIAALAAAALLSAAALSVALAARQA